MSKKHKPSVYIHLGDGNKPKITIIGTETDAKYLCAALIAVLAMNASAMDEAGIVNYFAELILTADYLIHGGKK